jgi:hypothetical protein
VTISCRPEVLIVDVTAARGTPPTPPAPAAPAAGLADAVRRLRAENLHLRLALRHRAVIEQAKGLFAARAGTGLDAAFDQLVRTARDTNRKLVDVAASYVAEVTGSVEADADAAAEAGGPTEHDPDALPEDALRDDDPSRPVPPELLALLRERAARRRGPRPTPDAAALRLALAALDDATTPRELVASAVADCVWPQTPSHAALYAVRADTSVELLASAGFDRPTLSAWRRLPVSLELPVTAAARGEDHFVDDPAEALQVFPELRHAPFAPGRFAALALRCGPRLVGVLYLGWQDGVTLADSDRRGLRHLADGAARALRRMRPDGSAVADVGLADAVMLMEGFGEPGVLTVPVDGAEGPVDLRVVELNAAAVADLAARSGVADDPVGRTLHELDPFGAVTVDAVHGALAVLAGSPAQRLALATGETLRVTRWRDGALLTWTAAARPEAAG